MSMKILSAMACAVLAFSLAADETAPDQEAVAERMLHLVRLRTRSDVNILGFPAHQEITDASADEIRRIAELGETVKDLQGVRIDVLSGNAMLRTLVDDRTLVLLFQKPEHLRVYYINFTLCAASAAESYRSNFRSASVKSRHSPGWRSHGNSKLPTLTRFRVKTTRCAALHILRI